MKLSVLVPVYNEGPNIRPCYARLKATLEALPGLDAWQVLFVNDGSGDDSLQRILELRAEDPRVKVATWSRNVGYHAGLTQGLALLESDLYAIVDVDGEDPPELLARFHAEILKGAQVAYGIRSNRDEPAVITLGRSLFYRINRWIADSTIVLWMGEFSMFTRQVRDAVLVPRTTYPFLRGEIAHAGFSPVGVAYQRARRLHGRSHYNLLQLTRFAFACFLASSTFPLRGILYLSAALGLAYPLAVLLLDLTFRQSVGVAVILLLYFCFVTVPLIALYAARIYKNLVGRPLAVLDRTRSHLT